MTQRAAVAGVLLLDNVPVTDKISQNVSASLDGAPLRQPGLARPVDQSARLEACRSKRHVAMRNVATGGRSASSAGSAGATCSWGEVRKGGEAPLRVS